MPLASGTRVGPYEVIAILGAGGMGEVYRARDTKLGRDVALKVLPDAFATDADRLARFQREAQLLASLNHPNIGVIHGLEDAPSAGSGQAAVRALVLELIEGETLADRIRRGPLPVDEMLAVGRQIADALEAAHERGVVHRDLKPANVKITPDGKVKVLDFGLAKAMDTAPSSSPHLSHSPTLSLAGTVAGMVLGTAAYMSPEQAKGLPADQRSDVFSFGCVLFEMLTGRQAFQAETAAESLAAILMRTADFETLPGGLHPRLRVLVQRCLEKDPKRRWQAVGDLRFELEAIAADPNAATVVAPAAAQAATATKSWWRRALPALVAAVVAAASASLATWWRVDRPRPLAVTRFRIPLTDDESGMTFRFGTSILAISPDGANLVYAANRQLYRRSMAEMDAHPIPGTENAASPFFSPDGRWIGFMSTQSRTLKKIAIGGGTALTLCSTDGSVYGASWDGDSIVFAQPGKGIMRVSADGGVPEAIASLDQTEVAHGPQLIDGGRAVLFSLASGAGSDRWDVGQIVVQSIGSNDRQVVVQGGSDARLLASGHLVYALGGTVLAVPYDASKRAVRGGPVPIVEGVMRPANLALSSAVTQFATSALGSMVYIPGAINDLAVQKSLAFADRDGKVVPLGLPPNAYIYPRVSPDGIQLVVGTDDGKDATLWVYQLKGGEPLRRLTFRGKNQFPIWSRDGRYVVYQSDLEGDAAIFRVPADGSGAPERLTTAEQGVRHEPESWNPTGDMLSFNLARGNNQGVWIWSSAGDRKPANFVDSLTVEKHSVFSPNGKWIAYMVAPLLGSASQLTQGTGVFVEPFPATGAKYQIATGGARTPLWSPDGRQLYYHDLASNRFVVVDVRGEPSFSFGKPTTLPVEGTVHPIAQRNYDITPDGKQLLVVLPASISAAPQRAGAPQITVVLNWAEELKARVPIK